jgi:starvation-inducible DNA-binding protein
VAKENIMSVTAAVLTREAPNNRQSGNAVVEHLQRQIANTFILYANYKHYHWESYGPLFRELHLLFDEFATAVLSTSDELAERLRFRGEAPVFDYRQMLTVSRINPSIRGGTMRGMVEEARNNLLMVISELRDATHAANFDNDPGAVDLFSKVVQIHEKHEWFLRELLRQNDGLTG